MQTLSIFVLTEIRKLLFYDMRFCLGLCLECCAELAHMNYMIYISQNLFFFPFSSMNIPGTVGIQQPRSVLSMEDLDNMEEEDVEGPEAKRPRTSYDDID